MSIGDKLETLRKTRKLTQEQVAELVGVSQVSYRNWEKDIKNPSANNLEKIAKAFHVSTLYLQDDSDAGELINFYKQLQPLRQKLVTDFAAKQLKEQESASNFIQAEKTYFEVKVFERVSAGPGAGVIGDGDYDTVLTDQNLPSFDIATWIDGDSMEPKFDNKSVVLLKDTRFDYDGAVYAVYVPESNTTYLKKVYREAEGLRLVSYNKKYPDRFISYEDNPQIVGKAIGNFNPIAV